MTPRYLTLPVPPELSGQKVDALLRRGLGLSGTLVRRAKWLPDGITLDGAQVHTGCTVQAGQVLRVLVGDLERRSGIVSAPGALDIVYEDEDLIVLNKPAGVLVHPGHGHFDDTLGNFLLYYYDQEGSTADFHPAHRLDKGTTGLLVVAKHAHAQEVLKSALHTKRFRRFYLAVCDGVPAPAEGIIDAPIARVEGSLMAREVRSGGQEARTKYRVAEVCGERSLVELELFTGRTHQIRVHMAHLGCPLTGDFLYGTENRSLISRSALHSARLELFHPITGAPLRFSLPLPEDMAALLETK